jgi:hypothetical protein
MHEIGLIGGFQELGEILEQLFDTGARQGVIHSRPSDKQRSRVRRNTALR